MITFLKIVPQKRVLGKRMEEKEVQNITEEFNQTMKENTIKLRR